MLSPGAVLCLNSFDGVARSAFLLETAGMRSRKSSSPPLTPSTSAGIVRARLSGLLNRSTVARILIVMGPLVITAGCGGGGLGRHMTPAEIKAEQDGERASRQRAYGEATIPPGTKSAAEKAPKHD